MKHKLREWSKRYLPAELVGVLFGLLAGVLAYFFSKNLIITAFVGTWAENLGYYGFIASRDIIACRKTHQNDKKKYGFLSFLKNMRDLFLEFGFSEVFDSFFIRPFCLYIFPVLLGNVALGLFVGMMVANVTFYVPTIIAYELKKKHLK